MPKLDPLYSAEIGPRAASILEQIAADWERYSHLADAAYEMGLSEEGDELSAAADELAQQFEDVSAAIEEGEDSDAAEGDLQSELAELYEQYRTGSKTRPIDSEEELVRLARWHFAEHLIDTASASDEDIRQATYDAWLDKTRRLRRMRASGSAR